MQAEFRQFRLNTWVQAVGAEIDLKKWAGCNEAPLIEGRAPCWAYSGHRGADDLAALGLWFPNSDGRRFGSVELFIPAEKVLVKPMPAPRSVPDLGEPRDRHRGR